MEKIATFHTTFGAQSFLRRLQERGDQTACIVPTPRKLSVSCGHAVTFTSEFCEDLVDEDTAGVYLEEAGAYRAIFEQD